MRRGARPDSVAAPVGSAGGEFAGLVAQEGAFDEGADGVAFVGVELVDVFEVVAQVVGEGVLLGRRGAHGTAARQGSPGRVSRAARLVAALALDQQVVAGGGDAHSEANESVSSVVGTSPAGRDHRPSRARTRRPLLPRTRTSRPRNT